MRRAGLPLAPTTSLPALRSLETLSEKDILVALQNLCLLYCPLPALLAFQPRESEKVLGAGPTPSSTDSGYASGNNDDDETNIENKEDALTSLRVDTFERAFALRWLTGLVTRVEANKLCFGADDDMRQQIIDKASCILGVLFSPPQTSATAAMDEKLDPEADAEVDRSLLFARNFSFTILSPSFSATENGAADSSHDAKAITVRLNDGLAGVNNTDHTDVGLQSWSASGVFCDMVCASPGRFGLTKTTLGGSTSPRIIEFGAGTGLVSLVLARLLPLLDVPGPTVIATDYHPTVLENLAANVAANNNVTATIQDPGRNRDQDQDQDWKVLPAAVHICALDWSAPRLEPPLHMPADVLVATDVVYAPGHASWLLDCAERLLAPDGVFWLMVTVRKTGRFEGISETVEAEFAAGERGGVDGVDGRRRLRILSIEELDKRSGVGRGDESGYKLFKIGRA